jgi:LuxR family maltose regulon positive regulatory protein
MSFFLNGDMGDFETADFNEIGQTPSRRSPTAKKDDLPLLGEKLKIPVCGEVLRRERLHELLDRSCSQFGGTLVSGRSGTGKTTLAADYAAGRSNVAWYSIDSADADWNVFSQYFRAGVAGSDAKMPAIDAVDPESGAVDQPAIAQFLVDCFANANASHSQLIVLDNIHHLFDSDWFCDFFCLMLFSLRSDSHALMLCRSKPPAPLWRLRSKQVLNVIDEKLLSFSPAETEELCRERGIARSAARAFHSESFGRPSKLMQYINSAKLKASKA